MAGRGKRGGRATRRQRGRGANRAPGVRGMYNLFNREDETPETFIPEAEMTDLSRAGETPETFVPEAEMAEDLVSTDDEFDGQVDPDEFGVDDYDAGEFPEEVGYVGGVDDHVSQKGNGPSTVTGMSATGSGTSNIQDMKGEPGAVKGGDNYGKRVKAHQNLETREDHQETNVESGKRRRMVGPIAPEEAPDLVEMAMKELIERMEAGQVSREEGEEIKDTFRRMREERWGAKKGPLSKEGKGKLPELVSKGDKHKGGGSKKGKGKKEAPVKLLMPDGGKLWWSTHGFVRIARDGEPLWFAKGKDFHDPKGCRVWREEWDCFWVEEGRFDVDGHPKSKGHKNKSMSEKGKGNLYSSKGKSHENH